MNVFHHKNKKVSGDHGHEIHEGLSNIGHDPHIDWLLILILGTAATLALIAAGFFAYARVNSILSRPPSPANNGASAAIDPGMLQHVLEQFEERSRDRAGLLKSYTGPADPSV